MVSRNLPFEYFVLSNVRADGAIVAYISGRAVRSTVIDADGCRYRFSGVARRDAAGRLDVGDLRTGEWIVYPNLVYASSES
jgi:hypothetical protein